ncbi:MAG TPA: hypothetical protein DHV62_06545 [Elusimicrobia bacterium]|nr:hypothetical protein [Elusimicrobiota bacterium]
MMPRSTFETLGYFDERFLTGVEDIDYFYRARLAGLKMYMTSAVWYWHKEGATRDSSKEMSDQNKINHDENIRRFNEKWGFNCCSEMYVKIFNENQL